MVEPKTRSNFKTVLIFIAILLVVCGIIAGITYAVQTARNNHIINDGVKTTGTSTGNLITVHHGRSRGNAGSDSYYVEYEFTANNKRYTARGTTVYNIQRDAERASRGHFKLDVYYLPDDPTQNYAKDKAGNY
jgi:hypothetical protein